MPRETENRLDKDNFIRHKMFDAETSAWKRYAMLVVGEVSIWKLARYELITSLLGPLPGAIGLALRKMFFPFLFSGVGAGVVFGRSLVIRNAHKIRLGDGVVVDDYSLLDARGSGEEGIVIGNRVIINRDVMLISKIGSIKIGDDSDIGSRSMVISTGGITIGSEVTLAGDCKIGGSIAHLDDPGQSAQASVKTSKGRITIGDNSLLYMAVRVLDGVKIGRNSVIGAGIGLSDSVPDETVVAVHQKMVYLSRQARPAAATEDSSKDSGRLEKEELPLSQGGEVGAGGIREPAVAAVFAAIDEINLLRPADKRIQKSLNTPLEDLDSMDKVNLIVETEQKLTEHVGRMVQLDSQALIGSGQNVFKDVESFVGAVVVLIGES